MIRVVQLLPADASLEMLRTADLLQQSAGPGFGITRLTFGRGGQLRNPLALGRTLKQLAGLDLLHAFGTVAATTATLASRAPLLVTVEPVPSRPAVRWLRTLLDHRRMELVCASALQHRTLVKAGVPIDACHMIRPGVEFARVRRTRDTALRASLGFADTDLVLLAPGETDRPAGHDRAVWVASILHVLDLRYKLLVWGPGWHLRPVAALARRLRQPGLLTVADRRLRGPVAFEPLLNAADAALITPAAAVASLPILTCMANALPIVAVTTRFTAEFLEDRHTAWMTTTAAPRELARRVLDLVADPSQARTYADRARSEAYDYFSASRLLGAYRPLMSRTAAGVSGVPAEPSAATA